MDIALVLLAAAGQEPSILFVLLIPVIWCCIVGAISLVGGWHSIAKRFPFDRSTFRPFDSEREQRFLFGSMSLGPKYFPVGYGGCVVIRVGEAGIGLKIWPMFRVLHPPMFIRWSDVASCERERYFLISSRMAVHLNDDGSTIYFHKAAGKAILDAWAKQRQHNAPPS